MKVIVHRAGKASGSFHERVRENIRGKKEL